MSTSSMSRCRPWLLVIPLCLAGVALAVPAKTPAQIPGLLAWFTAEAGVTADADGRVTAWADQGPLHADLAQKDASRQPRLLAAPLNGRPAISFRGLRNPLGGQSLFGPALKLQDATGLAILVVARVPETAYWGHLVRLGRGGATGFALREYANDGVLSCEIAGANVRSAGNNLAGQGFKLLHAEYDAATRTCRLFENGVPAQTAAQAYPLPAELVLQVGGIIPGADWGGSTSDIAEIIIYKSALSEADRAALQASLMAKYGLHNRYVSPLAPKLPFAYYPSTNTLEVAFDAAGAGEKLAGAPVHTLRTLTVRVLPAGQAEPVATGAIDLDSQGRGQGTFTIPNLPDGEYAVEYVTGGVTIPASQAFKRVHYPWEGNTLGINHTLYGGFTPLQVAGDTVDAVYRTYRLNGFGLFNSVRANGRELLAAPMRLHFATAAGPGAWKKSGVQGKALHPDLAEFRGTASSDVLDVASLASVEEDGCVKVDLTLQPGAKPQAITRAWIEIPLKDAEVPLFHYAADGGMRHNYGGATPRGGKITWDITSQMWCPVVWSAEPGPADGVIWDATQKKLWGSFLNERGNDPFVPYIWLGAEERGLAWFGENDRGYSTDGTSPVQVLSREGDRVVLRIYLINTPTTLTAARTVTFGLQASPTKPRVPDWRGRHFATGLGPVVCWGGYLCASKYPENHDFGIVDKIQEARKTGTVDKAYFEARDKLRKTPERKVHDSWPWLESVLHFANTAAGSKNTAGGAYFEEHATDTKDEEWAVFRDEWSSEEFSRFGVAGNGGVAARSYQDFCLYYGNEWLKRGVSLYFDNANPKDNANRLNTSAYLTPLLRPRHATTIWAQRAYYKRLWKRMQELNGQNPPWHTDITFHMTNTQVLPMNTWTTGTLDMEQRYRKDERGEPLPWPPDYTRTVTLSRQIGSIAHGLDALRNGGHTTWYNTASDHARVSDWGMFTVHEVRGGNPHYIPSAANTYRARLKEFGYGTPEVKVFNYWEEKPFVTVNNPQVKWLACTRAKAPKGLLVLQSYAPDALTIRLRFPEGKFFYDVRSRELFTLDATGALEIDMAADCGTRMLLVAQQKEELPPAIVPAAGMLLREDFEYSLHMDLVRQGDGLEIVADEKAPGNHVFRLSPAARLASLALQGYALPNEGDYELSFKVRVPQLPTVVQGNGGLLQVTYRSEWRGEEKNKKQFAYQCTLDIDGRPNEPTWSFSPIRALREGKWETFATVATNLTNEGRPGPQAPRRPELGAVNTDWHTVTLRAVGTHHTLKLDDQVVFAGENDASLAGSFSIGTGWNLSSQKAVPYIEIDDLILKTIAE